MQENAARVEQARRDPEAFRELYRQYFPRVYAYIAYRVGTVWDTEDLTADVFLRVLESLARFEDRGDGAFAAWIFRIAHNRVSQFYRDQQRLPGTVSIDAVPEIASDTLSPDGALAQKERFARLYTRIGRLSPRRQEIITLRYFGGLRNKEIAAVLNLDERTVAAHLARALQELERFYRMEETTEESRHE